MVPNIEVSCLEDSKMAMVSKYGKMGVVMMENGAPTKQMVSVKWSTQTVTFMKANGLMIKHMAMARLLIVKEVAMKVSGRTILEKVKARKNYQMGQNMMVNIHRG